MLKSYQKVGGRDESGEGKGLLICTDTSLPSTADSKPSPSKTRKPSVKAKNKPSEKPAGSPKVRGREGGKKKY